MIDLEKKNLISLREATQYCSYSQEYLSLRARNGKLKSVKIGRAWMTNREWLYEYLNRVEKYKEELDKKHLGHRKIEEPEIGNAYSAALIDEAKETKRVAPPLDLPIDSAKEELVFNEFPSCCYKPRNSFLRFGLFYGLAFLSVLICGALGASSLKIAFSDFSKMGKATAYSTNFAVDNILDLGADSLIAVGKDSDMMLSQIKKTSPVIDSALYGLGYTNDVFFEYLSWVKESVSSGIKNIFKTGASMESNLLFISLDILENMQTAR